MSQISPSTADEIRTRKVELALQQLDTLPTLPAVAMRLLALTGSNESKIQEVVELLSADQSLTGKLLSLAGSAMTGVRTPVTSVKQAVVLLGFEALRNLVLSVKVFEAFQQQEASDAKEGEKAGPPAFNRAEFWKHSLAVATAAEMLAARCRPKLNVSDAFVCGLLHDLGKVAFDTAMPKTFARVIEAASMTRGDVADIERRIIGLDHGLAGKRLAEAWNLPQLITQAIWMHGTPPPPVSTGAATGAPKPTGLVNPAMVLVVGLADMLVRRQHIGFSGNYLYPYDVEQYTQQLGLTAKDVEEITAQLTDALEARARAIGLYDVESRQLYLESIANANAELGRSNQELRTSNRKLAMRSTCFEMLTKFYQQIVPAASPAQLLAEIGQVGHAFFDSARLVLFSQDPDHVATGEGTAAGGIGDVLTFDPSVGEQDSFLMVMPPFGGDQRVGRANQNFIRPASPQLDWLLERVRPFLGTNQCWFMPLLCGNEPVGGVLWIAREHENSLAGIADMVLVSQAWGMTLRTAQVREQQTVLTESLVAKNRELGSLQQQLVRAKSLAGLGEMAAGAAHEMNNPLMVMSGRAQLLASKITDAGMKQEANLIYEQSQRLSQIITDMMEFAKPHVPKMGVMQIGPVVEEASKMAMERAGAAGGGSGGGGGALVQVKVESSAGIPEGRGDARQIRDAVVEVLINAIQATRAKAGAGAESEVIVRVKFDPLDAQVIVQVTDRGVGMSPEVQKNAFAPFFSAKSAGRNRGMGLAKAMRWVENHGGTIRLDSLAGQGTTATMIVPLNAGAAAGGAEAKPAPAAAGGGATVMAGKH